jgi:DNA-binding HxlR family transcriptional regulator
MTKTPDRKYPASSPEIDSLVEQTIARIADRWTMEILDVLTEHGTQRFSRIARHISGISQKMLTQTLRQMERDGLVKRTVHPVIPPHVDYTLTQLGNELSEAFCGVWLWAEKNARTIERARAKFDALPKRGVPKPVSSRVTTRL